MINVLYCFDSNYNTQAFVSMYSLLENISSKINIYIIHKSEIDESFVSEKIMQHKKLNLLKVFKISINNLDLYNIDNSHVSSATFFRIFIEDHLPKNIDQIFYIDCDILCINDPIKFFKNEIKKLNNSKSVVSASTEEIRIKNPDFFERIEMKGESYFNAGVMLIDINKWISNSIKQRSLSAISYLKERAVLWDQDILNYVIDGDYLELDTLLNYRTRKMATISKNPKLKNEIILLHYAGASKPWDIRGPMFEGFELFQNTYRKLFRKQYFLVVKTRRTAINQLFKIVFTSKFKSVEYKTLYLFAALKVIIFKN